MDLSLFYASFLGVYMLIFSLIMILRRGDIEEIVSEFFSNKGILYLAGAFSLLFGVLIAITHSVWEFNWRGLITLLGYLAIVKGIMRIGFQNSVRQFEPRLLKGKGYWIVAAVTFLIGLYLTYSGFAYRVLAPY